MFFWHHDHGGEESISCLISLRKAFQIFFRAEVDKEWDLLTDGKHVFFICFNKSLLYTYQWWAETATPLVVSISLLLCSLN